MILFGTYRIFFGTKFAIPHDWAIIPTEQLKSSPKHQCFSLEDTAGLESPDLGQSCYAPCFEVTNYGESHNDIYIYRYNIIYGLL